MRDRVVHALLKSFLGMLPFPSPEVTSYNEERLRALGNRIAYPENTVNCLEAQWSEFMDIKHTSKVL